MSRCILVLGVARSGTSAVAGALHRVGIRMLDGDRMDTQAQAGKANPAGTYEDLDFLEVGLRLQIYGFSLMTDEHRTYLRLIEERQAEHALWGFKEPRFMFVLEHFIEALGDCRAIAVSRDTRAIHQSTTRWRSDLRIPPLWLQMAAFQRAVLLFPGPRLTIGYERLVAEPEREVDRLAEFVYGGLGRQPTGAQIAEAAGFVDPSLKHY